MRPIKIDPQIKKKHLEKITGRNKKVTFEEW